MAKVRVSFRYEPGLSFEAFSGATLTGSWDSKGRVSPTPWASHPMTPGTARDGSLSFTTTVLLDTAGVGATFSWGVTVHRADGSSAWGIFAEVPDLGSQDQRRSFVLSPPAAAAQPQEHQEEVYRVSWHRARGAFRVTGVTGVTGLAAGADAIAFGAWAPNARAVAAVFGGPTGYIADDGYGIDPGAEVLALTSGGDGMWSIERPGFDDYVGRRYLYRITRDDGSTGMATDMFSRQQVGTGDLDPKGGHFDGAPAQLDGRPSCSVVADASLVYPYPLAGRSRDGLPPQPPAPEAAFWADELNPSRPVPHNVADLVIYELHVGALNPSVTTAGTFADALALLPYLEALGVNAVELMPMLQFDGSLSWGYGSSHFLAIESSAGGRDALKQFVKSCHQRGIAVLMDVVYNHYTPQAARAAWQYDTATHRRNSFYWYQGTEADYADPTGGYLDNVSSGWAPRYWDPHVRALFVSSAVALADDVHIDGLRVDQTASIHSYNSLHADGSAVGEANIAGRKFLRELCQTLKTIEPHHVLIAEDHSGWAAVTQPAASGGIGFDATWYVDFYHHLVGENGRGPEWAKLLLTSGQDSAGPLHMDYFGGALAATASRGTVAYHSNHDEAGNDRGTERTILAAVNGAALVGDTRRYAEARCRFACGMTMLSAGTPMFLMGDEVGAQKAYTYDKFNENKEDLEGLRRTTGAWLFRFYQDIIRFRLATPAIRSRNMDVLHTDNAGRVLAFRRWDASGQYVVVASLNNSAFASPSYLLSHPALGDAFWRECFNSDSAIYGGANVGNAGGTLRAAGGTLGVVVPANGFVVLQHSP